MYPSLPFRHFSAQAWELQQPEKGGIRIVKFSAKIPSDFCIIQGNVRKVK